MPLQGLLLANACDWLAKYPQRFVGRDMQKPPFPAQVILNGHEYVACQARKAGIAFTKQRDAATTSG
jgi:hypothetical protein